MTNLKRCREVQCLTQCELAKKIGVTKQTIYKWERGMTPVSLSHWEKYASLLGIDQEHFENILIETLKDYAIETGDGSGLDSAVISGRYDPEKLFKARAEYKKIHGSSVSVELIPVDKKTLLNKVVHDFSEKVANLATKRAEIHRGLLLAAINREILKIFPAATEEDQKGILHDLAHGTTGESFILAEVSRMNSSIAEIANRAQPEENGDQA